MRRLESTNNGGALRRLIGLVQLALLCATATATSCWKPEPSPTEITNVDLAELRVTPDSVPADGAALMRVTASVHVDHRESIKSVFFSTSAGSFLPTAATGIVVPVDSSGVATALLRAPRDIGTGDVRASGRTSQFVRQIKFIRAAPDAITIEPAALTVRANSAGELALTVRLSRSSGFVSPGYMVAFFDTMPGGRRGFFATSAQSNSEGVVTAKYAPGIDAPCGRTVLGVRVLDAPTLVATTVIEVLRVKGDTILSCSGS